MVDDEPESSANNRRLSSQMLWNDQCRRFTEPRPDHHKCFYKVLPDLRHANNKEYDPMFFTFGPYHAKFEVPLSSFDRQKVWIAKALTNEESFNRLRAAIEGKHDVIKKIYGDDVTPVDGIEALAQLLAIDALTVVGVAGEHHIELLRPPGLRSAICRDAMLLEQQLPLFILKAAIDNCINYPTTLEDVVSFYTLRFYPFKRNLKAFKWRDPIDLDQSMLSHIAFLITNVQRQARNSPPAAAEGGSKSSPHVSDGSASMSNAAAERGFEPSTSPPHQQSIQVSQTTGVPQEGAQGMSLSIRSMISTLVKENEEYIRLPSASKLQRCGIHFRAGEESEDGFTGIRFDKDKRELRLPQITVLDTTKAYLLNLAAHEALIFNLKSEPCPVSSYIALMDYLIDNEEDVSLLVEKQVINNQLASDGHLAEMWNTLATNLPLSLTKEDRKTKDDLRRASEIKLYKWWASFLDTYLEQKPWLFISVFAACLLLFFTVTATIFTILGYFLPPKSRSN